MDPAELGVDGPTASRKEWRAAGAPNEMFRDGRLLHIGGTAYALPSALESPTAIARLVGTMAPEGAVVTGWAAALLHGVRDAGPTMIRKAGSPIQLCLARGDHRVPPGFTTLRVNLDEDDVQNLDGVRVTTMARTAYDLARFSPALPVAVGRLDAFCCVLNPDPLDIGELERLRHRRPRGRGHPLLRSAEPLVSARSRSFAESRLRVRLVRAVGLSPADLAVNITLELGSRRWELDLLDWTSGLVLEYDSAHHAAAEQRDLDSLKNLDAREAELELFRVNSPTLATPDREFAALIRRAQLKARSGGAAERAAELRANGVLLEKPLRDFRSAAG